MANLGAPSGRVYIYNLGGIDPLCIEPNLNSLKDFGVDPSRIFDLKDPSYLKRELSQGRFGTMIVPGGSTFFIHVKILDFKLAETIRSAVAKGLNLLGQCAGANLASRNFVVIDPTDNQPSEAIDFWNLLPVQAICPALKINELNQFEKNRRMTSITSAQQKQFQCYWNEGSHFKILDQGGAVDILADYDDVDDPFEPSKIAAVQGMYGAGRVVALGVHPEIDPLPDWDENQSSKENRKDFLRGIFSFLKIIREPTIDP